jgi:hypothetical protein
VELPEVSFGIRAEDDVFTASSINYFLHLNIFGLFSRLGLSNFLIVGCLDIGLLLYWRTSLEFLIQLDMFELLVRFDLGFGLVRWVLIELE